jgi:hypothetical protein
MATYNLDDRQCEAIYLALKGEKNLLTLRKTKANLEAQHIHHAVNMVAAELRVLEGTGSETPGLLRMFNPQHDMLADGVEKPTTKGNTPRTDPKQGTLLGDESDDDEGDADPRVVGGIGDATADAPAPVAAAAITWADDVPRPRPEVGQTITAASGDAWDTIHEVMGYSDEPGAFRVVARGGWDGLVFSYGQRDAVQWRVLPMALDYPDASDPALAPLGSPAAIAHDLRNEAAELLSIDADSLPMTGALLAELVDHVVPMLQAVAPDPIAPDYVREHVTRELAQHDDNAHAIARLMLQYVDVVAAAAAGEDVAGATHDAIHAETGDPLTDPDNHGEQGETDASADFGATITGQPPMEPDPDEPEDAIAARRRKKVAAQKKRRAAKRTRGE